MEPESTSLTFGDQRGRRYRRYAGVASAVLLGAALTYIAFADPHDPASVYPQCPFKSLTGWNCPACGGLRMTHDLLHGHVAASINDNGFLLFGLPLLALWILVRRYRGRSTLPLHIAVLVVVSATAWTVVRNLPGFPLMPTILTG